MTTKSPNSRIGTPVDRAPKAPTNARSGPASQQARSWVATAAIIAIILAVVTAALTVTHTPAQAQSAVLTSNTGQTAHSTGQPLTSTGAKRAQAFTLLATASTAGYTVDSIGIAFHTIGDTSTVDDDLTVTLNANSSGSPGDVLCTLSNPSTFSASGVHTFDAPTTGTACPLLTQNKTYFAVIARANSNTDTISLNTTAATDEDSGGATGWSISNIRKWYTNQWGTTTGESHQIEIKGILGHHATGVPTITGTPETEQTLTANTSGIADDDGLTNQNFSYKWVRIDGEDETEINGATSSTYTLTKDDAYKQVKVKVTFNDDLGNPEGPLSSLPSGIIIPADILVSNTGKTSDSGGYLLNASFPKTAQEFTTGANDDGYTLSFIGFSFDNISDTSTAGTDLQVTLNEVDTDGNPGDPLCTFTDPSGFSASGIQTFAAPTTGTTCPTLTKETQYFAVVERIQVSGTSSITIDGTGSDSQDTGAAAGWSIGNTSRTLSGTTWVPFTYSYQIAVRGFAGLPNNAARGVPTISGTPRVDDTLTADTSGIADDDGLTNMNFSYKWVRIDGEDETEINGATSSTYTLTKDDAYKQVKVKVTFNDDLGNPEGPLSSLPSGIIIPADILVSNTGKTSDSGGYLLNASFPKTAQEFTTGANDDGYTLSFIGFSFDNISDTSTAGTDLQVTLNEVDTDGNPGDPLCTFEDPISFSASGVQTFQVPTGTTCPTLTKETKYFAVVERIQVSGTSSITIDGTGSDSQDTGAAAGWSIGNTSRTLSGTTWVPFTYSYQIAVRGVAVPTTAAPTATIATTSDLIPSDLTGNKFRLIFLTHSGQGVTSADIATYNTYVQSQANASSALATIKVHSSDFRVLASTEAVDARDNTGTTHTDDEPGVPIYWLNGSKVADDYADLYDGSWDDEANPTRRDGNTVSPGQVWTGSNNDGTENRNASPDRTKGLGGNPVVRIGHLNNSTAGNDPLHAAASLSRALTTLPFYALSPVFVVPPKVNSVALTSDPNDDSRTGDDDTYAIDDTLEATVSFNVAADITGSPELTLLFGTAEKTASCAAATNTTIMVCSYTVVLNDTAPLGVGVKANSLTLNGGTITETGETTSVSLAHDAVGLQSGHEVDAIRPTLVTTGPNAPKTSTNGSKIILTFSESVGSFDRSKITIMIPSTTTTLATNGGRVNGSTVELDLTTAVLVTSAAITVELATDAVEDNAGNGNLALAATSISNNVAAVADVPTALTAVPAPDTTPQLAFDLSWTAPASDGGSAITKHQHRHKTGSNAFGAWTDIPDSTATEANATSYTVKGLTANNPPTTFTFEVQAINANGDSGESNQASATVDVPDTTFPTLTEGNQKITVQWPTPDNNGSAILRYQIQQAQTVAEFTTHTEWTNIQNSGPGETNANSYTVTGLTNGILYSFGIRAVNSVGTGRNSYSDEVIPGTIPDAPTGLTAEPGDGQVRLQWTAPISDGGNTITGYEYQQKTSSTPFGSGINISGSNANTTEHMVTGLTNGTNYTFRVRAKNPMGEGLPSNEASATPVTVPSVPQNFTLTPGNGQVRLEWTVPASDGGSTILRYEYRHKAGTDSFITWTTVPSSNINTTQYTVTGVINGTLYTFEIRAATATTKGMGASETTTPMAVAPDAPRQLSTRSQNQAIELTWQTPLDNGGSPITRYEYRRRTGNGPFGTWMNIPNSGVTGLNATSYTVTGLTNGTSYHFKLRAVNNADESAASNEALGIPQAITTPDKPRGGQLSSGDGKVIVQWVEPLRDGGTPILHYEYCLRQKSQCNGHWVEIPDSAPGGDNHGLYEITRSNGTFTRVYLRAVNDQGAGHSFDYSAVPLAGAPAAPTNLRAEALSSEYVKISWNEPRARSGATIIGYSLEHSRDGVTWARDPYCQFPYCEQQYLAHERHPRGTNSIITRIGEEATLYYRIRTFFHTNTPTIVNDIDFSRGASPSSPIITVTTVGATGILALPTIGVTGGHGREGANDVIVFDLWITGHQQRTTPVTVIYRTVDLRARAGSDYSTRSGLLTFTPTDTEKTVSVPIIDDAVEDSGEEFILRLSNASGALIARAGAFGTITNTEESLTGFTLVDAATETDIGGVDDGDTVTLDDPADGQYGIRVETAPETGVNSVRLELSGAKTITRTDNDAPYTLYANGGEGLPPGTYTLQATAYPKADRGGNALQSISVSFTVAEATEEAEDEPSLTATFPVSPFQSTRHRGDGDRPQVIATFSLPVKPFEKTTPSVSLTGATVRSVSQHQEEGLENAWIFFLDPEDNEDIVFTLVAGQSCDAGGICTQDGATLSQGVARTLPGPEQEEQNTPATGIPTISGTPQVGETLTANTSGISDAEGLTNVSYRYQWTAGGSDIENATGSSHLLTSSQQGQTVQVKVTFTDDADNQESLTSAETLEVAAKPNTAAAGDPTISGTPQVEQTLTADTSAIYDANGLNNVSYQYQWLRDDADIAGQTNSTYELVSADEDRTIKVRVTFTDEAGNAESLTSTATTAVAARPAPVDALTASFANVPADHNGGNFTFQLIFSENVDTGYARIQNDAFTVSGGSIASASRMTQGSNQIWNVEVDPTGNGAVTITLPETTDCDATGAICTDDSRKLSHPTSAIVAGPPAISVSDANVQEAEGAVLNFSVTLSHPSTRTVTVDYATSDGTAVAGSDYTAASGALTFTAGDTSQTVQVTVLTDSDDESDETITLTLSNPSQATLDDGTGAGTIENGESSSGTQEDPPAEDPPAETPAVLLTASFANVPADHNGSNFTFQLSFSENVEAGYARIRDHAFTVTGATIDSASRITQGSNQGWNVEVNPTGNEAITITLPETTNCSDDEAICTDDERMLSHSTEERVEGPPAISVSDATVQEAEGATLEFSVTLSHASSRTVTVSYATQDVTATAGPDYTAASGALTFTAGDLSQTVEVTVLTDSEDEGQETLTLTLSNPSQATLDDATGTGTIENGESSSGTQEDPPVVLLTASFSNMPATHNGSEFTFDLAFSEDFPLSYVTLRDDAFTVDGGNVENAQRKVPGSNQTWTITVKPLGTGTISITLPETTDCNATGAICTDDERKLSNSTPASIAGPQ